MPDPNKPDAPREILARRKGSYGHGLPSSVPLPTKIALGANSYAISGGQWSIKLDGVDTGPISGLATGEEVAAAIDTILGAGVASVVGDNLSDSGLVVALGGSKAGHDVIPTLGDTRALEHAVFGLWTANTPNPGEVRSSVANSCFFDTFTGTTTGAEEPEWNLEDNGTTDDGDGHWTTHRVDPSIVVTQHGQPETLPVDCPAGQAYTDLDSEAGSRLWLFDGVDTWVQPYNEAIITT